MQFESARTRMSAAARARMLSSARGFTLIEILVALFILGILTALGYATYRQARLSAERTESAQTRTREIEFGVRIMTQDFEQIVPRPIRQPIGDGRLPAVIGSIGAATLIELTRGGWSNTAGLQRGTLERVSYRLDKDVLKRAHQTVLDAKLNNQPVEQDLLTGVKSVQIRYLDSGNQWGEQWPSPTAGVPAVTPPATGAAPVNALASQRPVAIELNLELNDWGKIRRLVEVAG